MSSSKQPHRGGGERKDHQVVEETARAQPATVPEAVTCEGGQGESGLPVTPPQSSGVRARVRSQRAWMRWQRRGADDARPLRSILRQALG